MVAWYAGLLGNQESQKLYAFVKFAHTYILFRHFNAGTRITRAVKQLAFLVIE